MSRIVYVGLALALSFGACALATPAFAASSAPVTFACKGPEVDAARKIALKDGLKIGSDPAACFGQMSIYGPPDKEIVAAIDSPKCKTGKLLDIYGKSRAGPWYSFFNEPVCGSAVTIGPKNPWGDWMITIDGKHYDNRAGTYVPVDY